MLRLTSLAAALALHWQAGDHAEAVRWWREAWADRPDLIVALDRGLTESGPTGAAEALAVALEARADSVGEPSPALALARWWVLAGEPEQAVRWIEHAADEGRGNLVYTALYTEFKALRDDPEMRSRLRRVGVPVGW